MTADEAMALGLRAVACKGWRWIPGMLAGGFRICRVDPHGYRFGWSDNSYAYRISDDVLPNLTDPATLGCLLALVREAWAADFIDVVCEQANDHEDGGYVWRVNLPWSKDTRGTTETEALVAALEAAP